MDSKSLKLPPDVFEAVVKALAEALVVDYRARWAQPSPPREALHSSNPSPWLTVKEAAARAQCGVKTLYYESRAGRLRVARVGGRREMRFRAEWIDEWLQQSS